MKLSILMIALVFAAPARAVEQDKPEAKSRCNVAALTQAVSVIPIGVAREADTVCKPEVWKYLDEQGKTAALYKNTNFPLRQAFLDAVTSTSREAALKTQQEILQSLADGFDKVDQKIKEIGAAVEVLKGDLKTLKDYRAPEGSKPAIKDVEAGRQALKSLILKEGDDLALEYKAGATFARSKNPVVGGESYKKLVKQMFELAGLDMVKRHLSGFDSKDLLDYHSAPDPKPQSFNLTHMSRLWVEKTDLYDGKAVPGDGEAFCAGQGKLPAFCAIDKVQGKKARELYFEARKTLNAANKHVLGTPGKTVAQIEKGFDQLIAQDKMEKAVPMNVGEGFRKMITGMTPEQAFDGQVPPEYQNLDPKAWEAAKAQLAAGVEGTKGIESGKAGVRAPGDWSREVPGEVDASKGDQEIQEEGRKLAQVYMKEGPGKAKLRAALDSILKGAPKPEEAKQEIGGTKEGQPAASPKDEEMLASQMGTVGPGCMTNSIEEANSAVKDKIKGDAAERSTKRQNARDSYPKSLGTLERERDDAIKECERKYKADTKELEARAKGGWLGRGEAEYIDGMAAADKARKACVGTDKDAVPADVEAVGAGEEGKYTAWQRFKIAKRSLDKRTAKDVSENTELMVRKEQTTREGELGKKVAGVYKAEALKRLPGVRSSFESKPSSIGSVPPGDKAGKEWVKRYFEARWGKDGNGPALEGYLEFATGKKPGQAAGSLETEDALKRFISGGMTFMGGYVEGDYAVWTADERAKKSKGNQEYKPPVEEKPVLAPGDAPVDGALDLDEIERQADEKAGLKKTGKKK
ncbi:MAG: hypothetical protein HY748_14265 [Elusimicrobia bacterium]|nr:hypothetical protein [Elusimicrobiota bacterium]